MNKSRENIRLERVIWNTQQVVRELRECFSFVATYFNVSAHNEAEKLFHKMSIYIVISNIYQLHSAYKNHMNLSKQDIRSCRRISIIRNCIFHANTDIEAIEKQLNNRGSYNVAGPNSRLLKTQTVELYNKYNDDIKIYWGVSYVLVQRDLARMTYKMIDFYNQNSKDNFKIEQFLNSNIIYQLEDTEPED